MNPGNLQHQINERCPCFAKPLNECDCEAEEKSKTLKTAIVNYLNYRIEIKLPLPKDDNMIDVVIHKQNGTYDPIQEIDFLTYFQFSAESSNPNEWVIEAMKYAIADLAAYGIRFYEQDSVVAEQSVEAGNSDDLDSIPF